jgi:hypothetical protein
MNSSGDYKEHLLENVPKKLHLYDQEMRERVQKAMKDDIVKKIRIRQIKYFKHWKDYDLLTCILAMIGLILAVVEVSIGP